MWKRTSLVTSYREVLFSVDNPIFRYVDYCMKFIDMLLKNSITPVIVFDGADLPLKENTNNTRRE